MKKTIVKVVQDENKPVTVEVLAAAIKAVSDGVKKLRAGKLKDDALILLIQHAAPYRGGRYGNSQVTRAQVKAVLDGIESLESVYLKK